MCQVPISWAATARELLNNSLLERYTEQGFKENVSPLLYSVLLIGLHGEFESKIKFLIYADDIRHSFRIQSCLVLSEK